MSPSSSQTVWSFIYVYEKWHTHTCTPLAHVCVCVWLRSSVGLSPLCLHLHHAQKHKFPSITHPSPCWWRWQLKLLCNWSAVRHHFAAVIQMFHLAVCLCQPISNHYLRVGDGLFIFCGIELSEGPCRIIVQTNIVFFIRFLLSFLISSLPLN